MPRIRILQSVAGLDFSWVPGDVIELDDEAAAAWADGERAELAPDDAPVTAQAALAQTTDEPPGDGGQAESGPFDPAAHSVKDVLTHLDTVDEQEALRVLQLEEKADTPRKGILKERDAILEAARERGQQAPSSADQVAAEKAAEDSRGGGRGDVVETR
ncbi:hypothetical protein ACIO02_35520 [Streptomyces sp. NPDC087568]|uniref:hypothetical protein n=1 Tax=Streptomyces sp. NPDC087568 TaxID=3365799 RepID=UPI00381B9EC1